MSFCLENSIKPAEETPDELFPRPNILFAPRETVLSVYPRHRYFPNALSISSLAIHLIARVIGIERRPLTHSCKSRKPNVGRGNVSVRNQDVCLGISSSLSNACLAFLAAPMAGDESNAWYSGNRRLNFASPFNGCRAESGRI